MRAVEGRWELDDTDVNRDFEEWWTLQNMMSDPPVDFRDPMLAELKRVALAAWQEGRITAWQEWGAEIRRE